MNKPEDSEVKNDIDIIKPLSGAPQLPFQPIIRSIKSLNICLSPTRAKNFDLFNILNIDQQKYLLETSYIKKE